jgi:tRNA (pseudouridine54-N1)-methyltransferase
MPDSTKLRFILILPNAPLTGDFILKDLPGSGKRIDILCRVLASCFDWGPINHDKSMIELIAVIADTTILQVQYPGANLPRGERAWGQVIKDSLKGTPPEYVTIKEGNLESLILNTSSQSGNLYVLHEEGNEEDLQEIIDFTTDNSFMLGDHRGFNSQTEELVLKNALRKISLGKTSYLSSHCVALIISEFERKNK